MNVHLWLSKFFNVKYLIPKEYQEQELPTTKEIYQKTIRVAWPSTMEAILISLISMVDMMMVGGLGTEAVAAVGITTQPKFMIMLFVLALNTATTVIVARRKGANDQASANLALKNALILSVSLSFVSVFFGYIYAKEILVFSGASLDYLDLALTYYQVILIGTFFYLISLTISAAQRGTGNTKISMTINLSANIVNVIFNYLLINGIWIFPRWGILGAAVATAMGNFVALILALRSLLEKDGFLNIIKFPVWKLDWATVDSLYTIASSSFLEQVFVRIGFIMYSKAVAGLGTIQFATHYIVMQMMHLSFSVGEGLSIATSSLVGQSLGAKRKDLAIVYGKSAQRLGLVLALLTSVMITLTRTHFMQLFSQDLTIIQLGSNILIILSIIVFFQILQVITLGSLRGAGDVKFAAKLSLISVTILRPSLTYIMAYTFGLGIYGAWLSVVVDQLIRYFFSRYRFHQAAWLGIEV